MNFSTRPGSSVDPPFSRSVAMASAYVCEGLYGRSSSIEVKQSTTERTRAPSGMASPRRPFG